MVGFKERVEAKRKFTWIEPTGNQVIVEIFGSVGNGGCVPPVILFILSMIFTLISASSTDNSYIIMWLQANHVSITLVFYSLTILSIIVVCYKFISLRAIVLDFNEAMLFVIDEHLGKRQRVRIGASINIVADIAIEEHRISGDPTNMVTPSRMASLIIIFKDRPSFKICTVEHQEISKLSKLRQTILEMRDSNLNERQSGQKVNQDEKNLLQKDRISRLLATISKWRKKH